MEEQKHEEQVGHSQIEQDRFLPIANIGRIMKEALPEQDPAPKIAKDSRETMQECVSDFISFITSEASDKCQADKRKTINGHDLIFALKQLGFERYLENLELYYKKYEDCKKLCEEQQQAKKKEDHDRENIDKDENEDQEEVI